MMDTPEIKKENVQELFSTRFIKVFDLQYGENGHYYDATRRSLEDLTAVQTEEAFLKLLPDAVTCIVILKTPGEEPRLLLSYEYRYPTGHFLISPPAGLIDAADKASDAPLKSAAKREIFEETGIVLKETDRIFTVSPLLFSTPGLTDESNGLVCAIAQLDDLSVLTQEGAEGTEVFSGFRLVTKEQAMELIRTGRDEYGHFYSAYTWCALMYFLSGMWDM